jgi:hypothetical protein
MVNGTQIWLIHVPCFLEFLFEWDCARNFKHRLCLFNHSPCLTFSVKMFLDRNSYQDNFGNGYCKMA